MNRREFIRTGSATVALLPFAGAAAERVKLAGEAGVTTGSFVPHLVADARPGKLRLLDLPRIMRDELGMKVIDLMTATLASMEPDYLDKLRAESERAGCVLTNLKMNQKGLDMTSADAEVRKHALDEYKRTIDAAARLGVRWVRPLPGPKRPDLAICTASYRELIDYAAPRGITVLIENYGWMQGDADAIPAMIKAVGKGLDAQPDTGNWTNNDVRYTGLARAFPLAVSCDFKARDLTPDGRHDAYDLARCFGIGWDAGFRGPWCIEHFHTDLRELYREMRLLRDQLHAWAKARN